MDTQALMMEFVQCDRCKLYFPPFEPKALPKLVPTLDGFDGNGEWAKNTGNPLVEKWCVFCDDPEATNTHATPGVPGKELDVSSEKAVPVAWVPLRANQDVMNSHGNWTKIHLWQPGEPKLLCGRKYPSLNESFGIPGTGEHLYHRVFWGRSTRKNPRGIRKLEPCSRCHKLKP